MSTAITKVAIGSKLSFTQSNGDTLVPSNLISSIDGSFNYSTGTGAGQINALYLKQRTIAGAGTLTIDVNDGSLNNLNNEALTFTVVKLLWVQLVAAGTGGSNDVLVNGAAANTVVNATFPLRSDGANDCAGEVFTTGATGWAVTAGTADKIVIVNNHASLIATVNVGIGGVST